MYLTQFYFYCARIQTLDFAHNRRDSIIELYLQWGLPDLCNSSAVRTSEPRSMCNQWKHFSVSFPMCAHVCSSLPLSTAHQFMPSASLLDCHNFLRPLHCFLQPIFLIAAKIIILNYNPNDIIPLLKSFSLFPICTKARCIMFKIALAAPHKITLVLHPGLLISLFTFLMSYVSPENNRLLPGAALVWIVCLHRQRTSPWLHVVCFWSSRLLL